MAAIPMAPFPLPIATLSMAEVDQAQRPLPLYLSNPKAQGTIQQELHSRGHDALSPRALRPMGLAFCLGPIRKVRDAGRTDSS